MQLSRDGASSLWSSSAKHGTGSICEKPQMTRILRMRTTRRPLMYPTSVINDDISPCIQTYAVTKWMYNAHCGALHWIDERLTKSYHKDPLLGFCFFE
ncbi:hypothetical protein C5167_049474 [Papaver somniferum]|uniref:Uncharacterized protein n=1 Tax=Papaver somniferum TaxID=3469 RepID=A0A4Y7KKX7_PAPSO|nr:hypothetical protein C5167_049474 [Papaver somniferum]